jgi:predicted amino acid-binding ACT domain protein
MSKKHFSGDQSHRNQDDYGRFSCEDLYELAKNGSESNRELILKIAERMKEFRDKHNDLVRITQKVSDKQLAMAHFVEKDHDDLGFLYNLKDRLNNEITALDLRVKALEQAPDRSTERIDKLEKAIRRYRRKTGKQAVAILGLCGLLYAGYKGLEAWKKETQEKEEAQNEKIRKLQDDLNEIQCRTYYNDTVTATPDSKIVIDSETESDG